MAIDPQITALQASIDALAAEVQALGNKGSAAVDKLAADMESYMYESRTFYSRMSTPLHVPVPAAGGGGGGDITTGLVHQWFMDDSHVDGTPNLLDSIGSDPTVTVGASVTSGASPAGAVYSTARAFGGTDACLLGSIPFDWLTGGPYSIAGWVKLTDVTVAGLSATRATFFCASTGVSDVNMIRIFNDINIGGAGASPGALCVNAPTAAGGIATATNSLVNNTWAHFCYTDTGGGAIQKLYFNGSLVASPQTGSGGGVGINAALIGSDADGGGGWAGAITGGMYRLEIWNRVLSATDVTLLFTTK